MASKIILFELNEVPFRIIDDFVRWRPQSCLARLLPLCRQFTTYSEDVGHLSPWKTWPTVHRGVNDAKHLINDFGEDLRDVDAEYPPIWKILNTAGVKAGVCGSLHTYPMPTNVDRYAFYIPDTFAAGSECFPETLSVYQNFNLQMARESARNVSLTVPWQAALRFLAAAPELGLTARTAINIGSHLVAERLAGWRRVRRRTLQVVLAFDIWMNQLRKYKPTFTTFFTNHVASSMHRYWAARFPDEYETFGYDEDWVRTYRNEIDYTMATFDRFLSQLVRFVNRNPDYSLWVTTSMGQAATQAKPIETQLYIGDFSRFMSAMGISTADWRRMPSMLPQYNVVVEDVASDVFRRSLGRLSIAGHPVGWREATRGFFSIDMGHQNLDAHAIGGAVLLDGKSVGYNELGLVNTEIDDKSGSSAYHIPQGSLLIYNAGPDRTPQPRDEISTLEIAPAILRFFDVAVPPYMQRPSAALASTR